MNKSVKQTEYITIPQLAALLGISRIAVYRKVRQGRIKAMRIGRVFAIPRKYVLAVLGKTIAAEDKKQIDAAITKTISEYGETLRLLGFE